MKKYLITALLALTVTSPAFAEKPQWAGKGKASEAMEAAQDKVMEAKGSMEQKMETKAGHKHTAEEKEAMARKSHVHSAEDMEMMSKGKSKDGRDSGLKGMEKQQVKKAEQMQNELGKGSEQGQAAREENSKKWWKFWGE